MGNQLACCETREAQNARAKKDKNAPKPTPGETKIPEDTEEEVEAMDGIDNARLKFQDAMSDSPVSSDADEPEAPV